ncbi:MAG: pilus assembly protein CpaF [Actinomycetota bacterium]|nr:pilus assembly protein CpaF [Actinomycetota bacterium]
MISLLAALAVGVGLALAVVSFLQRAKERDDDLATILQLPFGERDIPIEAVTESRAALLERTVGLATEGLEHFNLMARVAGQLERARLPLRPGEFVLAAAGGGAALGAVMYFFTGQPLLGVISAVAGPFLAWNFVKFKVARRRKAFEAQLPEALSLIASSLQAGHTALRSVQSMVEESEPPLSQEFERVVAETALGDPLVDALERMAQRLEVEDLAWVVQAIRIQQTVGGKLADLLHTLADFIRSREEIRREIAVLTAEGRISAWVLGAMPIFLLFAVQVVSPGYMAPLFKGWGIAVLAFTGMSIAIGTAVILRMVKIEV